MPNILVKIPKGSFPTEHRTMLVRKLTDAAATAEQIPDDPRKRILCWVIVEEVESGSWTCGAIDMTEQILPCLAMIYLPAGVLDGAARAVFVDLAHQAFKQALPTAEKRQLATSVMLHDVVDGTWGVNGTIWRLPDFAQAAGYAHLQSLVSPP
ncbi:tautomerase [Massilia violaceinigra]|uniref:Tautomerase n=1 Tax=Massilia violaceinigra TaxID=2045208 RepID=A0A2D2DQL0_9BURK|nr:tautomerase family protein [Massilia violaceinigra]ATQ77258.1 tautomerase [Massilia violaceinigra]